MPTSIPYDPALVLGNIVEPLRLKILQDIANAEKPIELAQDTLNSYNLYKRSLDMTIQEMINMHVGDTELKPLTDQVSELQKKMIAAAVEYGKVVVKAQEEILKLKTQSAQTQIDVAVESPIDYNKSAIKRMPLSSDSMKMDVQFFSKDENNEKAADTANSIASYVSSYASSIFGIEGSRKLGASATAIVDKQLKKKDYRGTTVITANCTHKQASVFAPFIIDVDKAIHAWNAYNTNDTIDMDSPSSVWDIASSSSAATDAGMYLLSGATYGSSFVGMVHIFSSESTSSTQLAYSMAESLRAKMELGRWFAKESGELGVDSSFSDSVKDLLSIANMSTHCSVITMGIIPTIKSNSVSMVVEGLSGGPQAHMEQLAAIQGSTNSNLTTVASSASSAGEGQTLSTLSTDYMKAAVDAISEVDRRNNQVLDTNSMMVAFDDYIQKAIEGECGVPIKFLLKPITKRQIAKAWVDKYYPNEFKKGNAPIVDPS